MTGSPLGAGREGGGAQVSPSRTRPGSLDNGVDLCSEDCVHTVSEGSCMSRVVGRGACLELSHSWESSGHDSN